jgi:hypothetical protein
MRFAATALVFAAAALSGARARADEPAWRFEYSTPVEGCPTRERAQSLVVARLGFDPFRDDADAMLYLRIVITQSDPGGLTALVARGDGSVLHGERTLRDVTGDCAELTAAAALAGSILVDPTGTMARRQAARTEPPPSSIPTRGEDPSWAERTPPPPPVDQPKGAAKVAMPLRAFLGARVLGSAGFAPSPSLGVSVDGGLRRGNLVLRLEGRADFPASSDPTPDGARARASLLAASVVPCFAFDALQLCGVFIAGSALAQSENVSPPQRDRVAFVALGLRPTLDIALTSVLHLALNVEGVVPLTRLGLVVRGQQVWAAPPVAASVGAGLLVHFL